MFAQAPERLQVLMTGVESASARDVARLIVSEGAGVIAMHAQADALACLERDLRRQGVPIETAQVDLGNPAEVRVWQASLSRRPKLIVCCCGAIAERTSRCTGHRMQLLPNDVSLSGHSAACCPARAAVLVLWPTLFLHAEFLRPATFDRTLAVVRHPTLLGVLARANRNGFSDATGLDSEALTAPPANSTRRRQIGGGPRGGRIRLLPPSDRPAGRADAA